MNKLCFIITDFSWHEYQYIRAFKNITREFSDNFNVSTIIIGRNHIELPFTVDIHLDSLDDLPDFNAYVISQNSDIFLQHPLLKSSKFYSINNKGVIKNSNGTLDDYAYLNTHIFNRLSSKKNEEFIYAPFGVSAIFTNMGKIDAFGNRIAYDYRNKINRSSNEKIIVILGGSAAYGLDCHFEDTFGFQLQTMLNQYCINNNKDYFFSVLNFSQIGEIILEQTMRYILFCHQLRPDIVISHDGWNDLALGLVSDPFLLNQHEICHRPNFEDWAQKLHNTESEPKTQESDSWEIKNLPDKVIKAYIDRKLMLKKIVEANSGEFIWGFQAGLFSKKEASNEEIEHLSDCNIRNFNAMFDVFDKKLPFVFDQASLEMESQLDFKIINFHSHFSQFGKEKSFFFDRVHTQPDGEQEIANFYFENILEDYLKKNKI